MLRVANSPLFPTLCDFDAQNALGIEIPCNWQFTVEIYRVGPMLRISLSFSLLSLAQPTEFCCKSRPVIGGCSQYRNAFFPMGTREGVLQHFPPAAIILSSTNTLLPPNLPTSSSLHQMPLGTRKIRHLNSAVNRSLQRASSSRCLFVLIQGGEVSPLKRALQQVLAQTNLSLGPWYLAVTILCYQVLKMHTKAHLVAQPARQAVLQTPQ